MGYPRLKYTATGGLTAKGFLGNPARDSDEGSHLFGHWELLATCSKSGGNIRSLTDHVDTSICIQSNTLKFTKE